jgi:hypothetical protein
MRSDETDNEKVSAADSPPSEGAKEAMNSESEWNVYRTRFLVRARQLTQPLAFTDALGREQSGQSGDYLVEFSDGIKRITNQALFEDIYVPLVGAQLATAQLHSPGRKLPGSEVSGVLAQSENRGSPESRHRATA